MENKNKTIVISKDLWLKLSQKKLEWGFGSFDTLIKWMLIAYESTREKEE